MDLLTDLLISIARHVYKPEITQICTDPSTDESADTGRWVHIGNNCVRADYDIGASIEYLNVGIRLNVNWNYLFSQTDYSILISSISSGC